MAYDSGRSLRRTRRSTRSSHPTCEFADGGGSARRNLYRASAVWLQFDQAHQGERRSCPARTTGLRDQSALPCLPRDACPRWLRAFGDRQLFQEEGVAPAKSAERRVQGGYRETFRARRVTKRTRSPL